MASVAHHHHLSSSSSSSTPPGGGAERVMMVDGEGYGSGAHGAHGGGGGGAPVPTDVAKGFEKGARSFMRNLYLGVTGVVADPVRGLREQGLSGGVRGVGTGLTGLVARPVRLQCQHPHPHSMEIPTESIRVPKALIQIP